VAELAPAGLVDLGCTEYAAAHHLQLELVRRRRGGAAADLFLVTEHRPVFTLGRRGSREHLTVTTEFLRNRGIEVLHVERGGDITYHGPGQLVLYPILHLGQNGLGVAGYVDRLEEVMLRLAAACGVQAARDHRNRGVWVGGEKLGSVGIAVRHGVAFHGLALNANPDLTPFSWVNPCGLIGIGVTSLSRIAGRDLPPAEVKKGLAPLLGQLFGREITLLPGDKGYGHLLSAESR
jgi:lipoyl(octanoyl) transferase